MTTMRPPPQPQEGGRRRERLLLAAQGAAPSDAGRRAATSRRRASRIDIQAALAAAAAAAGEEEHAPGDDGKKRRKKKGLKASDVTKYVASAVEMGGGVVEDFLLGTKDYDEVPTRDRMKRDAHKIATDKVRRRRLAEQLTSTQLDNLIAEAAEWIRKHDASAAPGSEQ